jgi:hypothetical protein
MDTAKKDRHDEWPSREVGNSVGKATAQFTRQATFRFDEI